MMPNQNFPRLVLSNLTAQAADQIGLAASPIVAVVLFDVGPTETGLLLTFQSLPFLLLSLPAGLLADRYSRTHLMIWSELFRAFALLSTLLMLLSGALTLHVLAILGFIASTGTAVYNVSAPPLVASLVPRERLSSANGNLELVRSVAYSAGPAVAGFLVARVTGSGAFALATALSVIAALFLMGLPEPGRKPAPAGNIIVDLKLGALFVLQHPLLRPIFLTAIFFNIAFFTFMSIFVLYATRTLGLSPSGIGATLAAYGLGMIFGALVNSPVTRRVTFGVLNSVGPVCGLISGMLLALMIFIPSPLVAAAAFFLFGAGPRLWTISSTTLRQTIVPQHLLGRVSAIFSTATYGSRPLGAALGGAVGGLYGLDACILIALCGFFLQAAFTVLSPVARLAQLPEPVVA
jgi:predicted MFS family arabinose efflux permease